MGALDANEFERRWSELMHGLSAGQNEACIECHGCRSCARSTFCRDSERLVGCHYCVRCSNCTDCSHCHDCERMVSCHHCVASTDCTATRYAVRSVALSNCNYCFGCVGLSGRDFHILNEPYSRQAYFEVTAALARRLGLTR